MMNTLVSVVIPTYKHGELLAEAIESALAQDYPQVEVIVVNDGSPDETRTLAQRYAGRIVYVERENGGVTAARNTGIRKANGAYIAFLDGDDLLLPGSVARRAAFLDAHPEIAMVCGDAEILGRQGIEGLYSVRSGKPQHFDNFRWETIEFCALPSTAMVRRDALQQVGLFDEQIKKAGAEDWNLWVRMSLHFNMAYLDQPFAQWRWQGQNTSNQLQLLQTNNRYAVGSIVHSPEFQRYPSRFRARLLYFQFACVWRVEPKTVALRYLWRALTTHPGEIGYGVRTVGRGLRNLLQRRTPPRRTGESRP